MYTLNSEINSDSALNRSIIDNLKVDIYHRLSCWAYLVHYFLHYTTTRPKTTTYKAQKRYEKDDQIYK